MTFSYRSIARQRLEKATRLISSCDEDDLVYACLELRKCVEALAYDLLTAYLNEVPLSAFEVWQPDKVMRELLQVDPRADRSARISMQREATGTQPAGPILDLGEDRRLKAPRLTKIFHQLGNALHVPTIRQLKQGEALDRATLRERAEKIKEELEAVLSAKVWNAHFSASVTFDCTECSTPVRRSCDYLDEVSQVRCGGCGQPFAVQRTGDDYIFVPTKFSWRCDGCGAEREIAESKAKAGLDVSCPKCSTQAILSEVTIWRVKQTPTADEGA